MLFDFHTHTFYSDGELSPLELARRASVNGYTVLAITDHAGPGNVEFLMKRMRCDRELIEQHWSLRVLIGVELTHVPAGAIGKAAEEAKRAGAEIVVVHGETPVEPVEPGTNHASAESPHVDVLAHPGVLTPREAELAAVNGVYIEISSRRGHCLGNGRTVALARDAGTLLLVNSDSHAPGDLHTERFVRTVALGAGVREDEMEAIVRLNPESLLKKLGQTIA